MSKILQFIIIISHFPILITVSYGAYVYKGLGNELKAFSYFLFFSGVIAFASLVFWFYSKNNMPLLHIYVAGGFFFLALFYQRVLNDFIEKKVIYGILISFSIFTIANSLFIQSITTFNSYALTIESVLIVILSILTYLLMMEEIVKKRRMGLARSLNWINCGLFLYYSSNLLIFYFGNIMTHTLSKEVNRYTWILHNFFMVIMYCCFFIGLWYRPRSGCAQNFFQKTDLS